MLWVIFALLTGAAVFAVLWPLSRPPVASDAKELDVAFYKAQTAEIERDTTRGVIGPEEAQTARNEAARRLLAAASKQGGAERAPVTGLAPRLVALGTLLFVPAVGLGLYMHIGAPNLPDAPLEARLKAAPANMDMATAIAKIEQHLAQDPNDGRGWMVIAPIYVRLGRADDAVRAYANAIRTLGPSGDRYAGLGEAQMAASGGTVTAVAKASFDEALKLDPKSPRAAFYLGVAAEQDGDKPKAVEIWTKLLANSPADAPWIPTVRAHIAEAGGTALPDAQAGPPGVPAPMAKAVAAMAPDQQQAMIHRMVDGLADRLKTNGSDIEGWLRLMRAYRVLNEQDKAKGALTEARRNFAADPAATKRIDDLAHELGLEG